MTGEFSVCRFFDNGDHEYVGRHVDAEEAVNVFKHYTNDTASRIGAIARVVIVNGLDEINYEWKYGVGITFPKEGQGGRELN